MHNLSVTVEMFTPLLLVECMTKWSRELWFCHQLRSVSEITLRQSAAGRSDANCQLFIQWVRVGVCRVNKIPQIR